MAAANAGNYTQNFNAPLSDGSIFASNKASSGIVSGELLMTGSGSTQAISAFRVPDLDPGSEVVEFTVRFDLKLWSANVPADGLAIGYGDLTTNPADLSGGVVNLGEKGFAGTKQLAVCFDTFDNGGGEGPAIEVFANGVMVKKVSMASASSPGGNWIPSGKTTPYSGLYPFDAVSRRVTLHWESSTGLDVTITGSSGASVSVMTDVDLPGFLPSAGNVFAWSARTGGQTEAVLLDNISISTTPVLPDEGPPPLISEIQAENKYSLLDEEGDSGDWVEIYNPRSTNLNLEGWHLTDDPLVPDKWTIPAGWTLLPRQYALIWLDGKNRIIGNSLHANFTLPKSGGYVAISRPNSVIADELSFAPQAEDVSYGSLGNARTFGYLATPTPNAANAGTQTPFAPSLIEPIFNHEGGLISASFRLTATPSEPSAAVLRYTTDNSIPTATSPIFPAAGLTISGSSNIRARYFETDHLPGAVKSRTFILLDASLKNYRGKGTPFSSNLPIIVLDSFGANVDGDTNPSGQKPFRTTYAIAIDRDPLAGNKAIINGTINAQNRAGTHVRGETSSGFPQKPYALEFWDNDNRDKKVSLLGWPEDSDYVLVSNYNDKSLIRNILPFETRRQCNVPGVTMRTQFVEVFFKQNGSGPLAYTDYKGIYVLTEKIKVGKDRVDIAPLDPYDGVFTNNPEIDDAGVISGGYIIRKDKPSDAPEFITNGGVADGVDYSAQTLQIVAPEAPSTAQQSYIKSFMNRFEAALYGPNFANPTTGYAKYIDAPSWIDGHIWVEIFKQFDGYRLSTYLYKDRNGKLKYAPLWDYNLSLGNVNPAAGYRADAENPVGWYYKGLYTITYPYHPRIFQDPLFLRQYWDRYWELRRTIFSNTNIMETVDGLIGQLKYSAAGTSNITNGTGVWPSSTPSLDVPVGRHHARWQRLGLYDWPNGSGYELRTKWETAMNPFNVTASTNPATRISETAFIKTWIMRRLMWMDDQSTSYDAVVRNFKPPTINQLGGKVNGGFVVSVANPNTSKPGTHYYTADGSDPADGTGISLPSGSLTLTQSALLKFRIKDTSGNWSPLTTANFIVNAVPASAENLAVSEIHYNPLPPTVEETNASGAVEGNAFEYIELLNIGAVPVDLTGCTFTQGVTFDWTTADPEAMSLNPGQRLVIVGNKAAFLARYGNGALVAGEFAGNLSNGGEVLSLLDANGAIIKSFAYDDVDPWPLDSDLILGGLNQVIRGGYSLVLNTPLSNPDHGDGRNWRSSAALGGNPGNADGLPFTGARDEDQNRDGVADIISHALGLANQPQPASATPGMSWAEFFTGADIESCLVLTFTVNLNADQLSVAPELTSRLDDWTAGAIPLTRVSTQNNGNGTATVTWRTTNGADQLPAQVFARLRVVRAGF